MSRRSFAWVIGILLCSGTAFADDRSDAEATFQKQLADTNKACGTKIPGSIDWKSWEAPLSKKEVHPRSIGGELCGEVLALLANDLCKDDAGKAAAKAITSYRCDWSGKMDGKHSFSGGVLVGSSSIYADLMWLRGFIGEHFPGVEAGRVIPQLAKEAESDWKEATRDYAPGLAFEADTAAFAAKKYPEAARTCFHDLTTIVKFLGTTYGESPNKLGRVVLKQLKRAVCTVGEASAATIKGDTLVYTMAAAGKPGGPFQGDSTEGWAWGYNQLRVTQKLGGPCAGAVMGDASPACEKAAPGVVPKPKSR